MAKARGTGAEKQSNARNGWLGHDEKRDPAPYNFRRPDKFSKDHIRSIQSIQDTYNRLAMNVLASKARAAVHIELSRLEQSTIGEHLDGLPDPTVLYVCQLDPLPGRSVIQLDRGVALLLVDRMLGGNGTGRPERTGAPVTEIEMLLLEDLGKGLVAEFVSAWQPVIALNATACDVLLSAQQIQGLLPTEVSLIIRCDVRLLNYRGRMSICLPASSLEPLMPKLNARLLFANPRTKVGIDAQRHIESQLEQAALTVRAELGRARIRLTELTSLVPGDIIRLDASPHDPLPVLVEDRICFYAHPGQRGGQLAVRIAACVDDTWTDSATRGSD